MTSPEGVGDFTRHVLVACCNTRRQSQEDSAGLVVVARAAEAPGQGGCMGSGGEKAAPGQAVRRTRVEAVGTFGLLTSL